MHGPMNVKFT